MNGFLRYLVFSLLGLAFASVGGWARTPGVPDLTGDWDHVGNGSRTVLKISRQEGNTFSGTMHGDPLINGRIEGNRVTFTRRISATQIYTGTLSVDGTGRLRMEGTFTQKNSRGTYAWSSVKRVPGGQSVAHPKPHPRITEVPVSAGTSVDLMGTWTIGIRGGFSGRLIIDRQAGGTFEALADGVRIKGTISGKVVTFSKPFGNGKQFQKFVGKILFNTSGNIAMEGTLRQSNTTRSYYWSASRLKR